MKYEVEISGRQYELIATRNHDGLQLTFAGDPVAFDLEEINPAGLFSLLVDGTQFRVWIEKKRDNHYRVKLNGQELEAEVSDQNRLLRKTVNADEHDDSGIMIVLAPIPGLILDIEVEEGQQVAKGDGLVIMEAMKMENEIKAPGAGIIQKIHAKPKDIIDKDVILLEIVSLGTQE